MYRECNTVDVCRTSPRQHVQRRGRRLLLAGSAAHQVA